MQEGCLRNEVRKVFSFFITLQPRAWLLKKHLKQLRDLEVCQSSERPLRERKSSDGSKSVSGSVSLVTNIKKVGKVSQNNPLKCYFQLWFKTWTSGVCQPLVAKRSITTTICKIMTERFLFGGIIRADSSWHIHFYLHLSDDAQKSLLELLLPDLTSWMCERKTSGSGWENGSRLSLRALLDSFKD